MITDAILSFLAGLVSGLLDLMPDWSPDVSGLTDLTMTAGSSAYLLNGYFPVGTLLTCALILGAYRLFNLVWALLTWVYSVIPFKMT